MQDQKANKYPMYRKITWVLYAFLILLLIIFLATVVAADNEERLFYSLMAGVGSYAFRPTKEQINWVVLKLFGVNPPEEIEEPKEQQDREESDS